MGSAKKGPQPSPQTWFQQASSFIGNSYSGITNASSELQPFANNMATAVRTMVGVTKEQPIHEGVTSLAKITNSASQLTKKVVSVTATQVAKHVTERRWNFAQISGHESHAADLPIVLCEKGVRLPGPGQWGGIPRKYEKFYDYDPIIEETRMRYLKLYRAAIKGDWLNADTILNDHPEDINARISKQGDTALHIAAAAKRVYVVKRLVKKKMKEEELAIKNIIGNTSLCLAASTGMVELAQVMVDKNSDLAMTRGNEDMLPIHMAALLGHRQMVDYLYKKTNDSLNNEDRAELLLLLIKTELYDVALELLREHEDLAIARDHRKETALHALARLPPSSSNFANHNVQGILEKCFNLFSGTDIVHGKKMHPQAYELVQELWTKIILLADEKISEIIGAPWRLIFVAAEQGNVELLAILIREYPDIIWKVNDKGRTLFHIAILNRHEDIFKLIYEIGSIKDLIATFVDDEGNNMLHMAGIIAPTNRLNVVSGAALQLQRELLWFKEVSKVVQPTKIEAKNKSGETPKALFSQSHKNLIAKGEKWMKGTANSCMLVATLIATVVFAAAFTVPGGNKEDTGVPFFLQNVAFKIFVISDAVSLISSSISILAFLSILTSRYAEEDFMQLLPAKLVLGLTALFMSIGAMMVVFCSTVFIIFQHEMLTIAVLVTTIASLPVILFTWQQYHLFVDVLQSTYISSSLFHPGKPKLFYY